MKRNPPPPPKKKDEEIHIFKSGCFHWRLGVFWRWKVKFFVEVLKEIELIDFLKTYVWSN
jgi:hypothetical protein